VFFNGGTMNQTQKRTHWASILEQQKQSQLSIKQFCQNNNICYHTFFYWSKRLRSPDPAQTLQPIEFDEFHHSAIGSVVLNFTNGIRAQLPVSMTAQQIKHWLDALR
ncbi:MAG: IS66 family insertion sequence element accessory protein TnpA, partial [Vibrio sp.]